MVPILLIEQNLSVVRAMATGAVVLDTGRVAHRGGAHDLLSDPARANSLLGVSVPALGRASASQGGGDQ
jgi:branched-chain amino acid transport system ATP-binding protein